MANGGLTITFDVKFKIGKLIADKRWYYYSHGSSHGFGDDLDMPLIFESLDDATEKLTELMVWFKHKDSLFVEPVMIRRDD